MIKIVLSKYVSRSLRRLNQLDLLPSGKLTGSTRYLRSRAQTEQNKNKQENLVLTVLHIFWLKTTKDWLTMFHWLTLCCHQ